MMKKFGSVTLGALLAVGLTSDLAAAQDAKDGSEKIALPAVSAEADPRRGADQAASESVQAPDTLQKITVEPGVNEIIQIAVGHPNRIVTPFKAPRVVTSSQASVETSSNVIYVVPANDGLITMFLTETGDERVSISLTLQPKQIPPRELRLDLPAGVLVAKPDDTLPALNRPARSGGSRAYVAQAGQVFDQLARGQVPQDFAFSRQAPAPFPLCSAVSDFEVSFSKGQYLLGQGQEIYVGIVRNGGSLSASFAEAWCYSEGVIAVALWPRATLQPGEYAEIYLSRAVAAPADLDPSAQRPSLLQASGQ